MTAYDPIEHLGLRCPADAQFYICAFDRTDKYFLGCCTTDPCPTDMCPDAALRPSYFNPESYQDIPPQACYGANDAWWTCGFGATFLGCCEENPCQAEDAPRCDKVRPARVSQNRTAADIFVHGPPVLAFQDDPAAATGTGTGTGAGTAALPSSTATGAPNGGEGDGTNSKVLTAAIGAVSGVLALIVIAALIFWYLRRKRRENSPAELGAPWLVANRGDSSNNNYSNSDPSSLPPANPQSPYSSTPAMARREKGSTIYSSGVSELDSQILSQGGVVQPATGFGLGFNPAKGHSISPGQSPYATPYASQVNSPSPYQAEFSQDRHSAVSGYAQSYGLPTSPSPSQQGFLSAGASNYASPPPPGHIVAELASTPAPPGGLPAESGER